MFNAAVGVHHADGVENEGYFFHRRIVGRGWDDRIWIDDPVRGHATILKGNRKELLSGAVADGIWAKELEDAIDFLVLSQSLEQERSRFVDALANQHGLILTSARGHARTGFAGSFDTILVKERLDGVCATHTVLGTVTFDVSAICFEVKMYGFGHVMSLGEKGCEAVRR